MNKPLDDQPTPQPPPISMADLPPEDIPLVLNSLIAEQLLDFKRLFNGEEFIWTGTGSDGTQVHELFDFVHNDGMVLDLMQRFCRENQLGFQFNFVPAMKVGAADSPEHVLMYLLRPDAGGNPSIAMQVTGRRFAPSALMLLCGYIGADPRKQHRELFPGRYLATQH
jgi:hypothetical protein